MKIITKLMQYSQNHKLSYRDNSLLTTAPDDPKTKTKFLEKSSSTAFPIKEGCWMF